MVAQKQIEKEAEGKDTLPLQGTIEVNYLISTTSQ